MRLGPCRPFSYRLVNTTIWPRKLFEPPKLNWHEAHRFVRIIRAVRREFRHHNPELVHFNFTPSKLSLPRDALIIMMARYAKIPIAVHFHGNLGKFSSMCGIRGILLKFVLRNSTVNILMNTDSLAQAKQIAPSVPARYVPNFIEKIPHLNSVVPESSNSNGAPLALFVGGICKSKGALDFLKACAKVRNLRAQLVGIPVPGIIKECRDLTGKFGMSDRVIFSGGMPHDEVMQTLRKADIFCLPSHGEGFPVSVLEAMASGLPVVATKVGAIPDIVDEGQGGLLSDVGDTDSLASNLRKLATNQDLRRSMGLYNGDRVMTSFTYKIVSEQLAEIYDEFCLDLE